MKLPVYLFSIFAITLISLGTWFLIIFNINPYQTDIMSIAAFFASLFIWLSGVLTLLFFYIKVNLANKEIIFAYLPTSIRHAILISLSLTAILVLSSLQVLTWWSGALIIIPILLLGLFFRTKKANI